MRSLGSLLVSTVAVLAIHSRPLVADVFTVGPAGSGADFSQIQLAIDAAQTGDTVLVFAGSYAPFVLDKALSVIGAGNSSTTVLAPSIAGVDSTAIEVRDIPQGAVATIAEVVALSEYASDSTPIPELRGTVELVDNAGQVILHAVSARLTTATGTPVINDSVLVIENCALVQLSESECLYGRPSARIEGSSVWLNGATIIGGEHPGHHSGLACALTGSTLYLSRSLVRGANGGSWLIDFAGISVGIAGVGGSALKASSSTLKFVGGPEAEIRGGNGGFHWDAFPQSQIGGNGLVLTESSIALVAPDMPLFAGIPDELNVPWAPFPQEAFPIFNSGSTAHQVATVYPSLRWGKTSVALGHSVGLSIAGNPSVVGVFALSPEVKPATAVPGIDGATILPLSAPLTVYGYQTNAAGTAARTFQVPLLPELVGLVPFVQGLEIGPAQNAFSNPAFLVIR